MEMQKKMREEFGVGVLTRLPPNYDLPKKVEPALLLRCRPGQKLRWLGLRQNEQLHWFGVAEHSEALCGKCWEQSSCPREFCFAPTEHEIALGSIPVNTPLARRLLRQSRSWIEATQSYEKIQLGLGHLFLNSLRLAGIMGLLTDTVLLLRAHALTQPAPEPCLLKELLPSQLTLALE